MAQNQFIYAVSRIRSKELYLLDKLFIEQLLAAPSYDSCLRLLREKGWGRGGNETAEELLTIEREKIWELMRELVEDISVFDTFLYINDFHNLKAAIKEIYKNEKVPNIYISHGTISQELIYNAVKEHDFTVLPEYMRECAKEAYYIQFHTGDGQLCDVIIDRAALETILVKAKASQNELLQEYAQLKAVTANINIGIRGFKTGKSKEFLDRALVECETLSKKDLIEAVLAGEEEIYRYLSTTSYGPAVEAIKESPAAFERWCDNLMINRIKPQKYNPFTLSPLAAYILARENEIKTVRILLSGKLNDIGEQAIRERLREMYV